MINQFIRFCFIFSFFYFSATLSNAQLTSAGEYTIRHFTDENGLPQNSINDVLFDDQGYCWMGSQVGLVRFNGYAFKLYYPDDKPVMESNVRRLGKNARGNIYFQTIDHNLYCYPGNNSHRLSPVNSWNLADPRLLNDRQQIFDFSRFLHSAPDKATEKIRRQIFTGLLHNSNFYAVDSVHTYLVYQDSLFYYDGEKLRSLSRKPDTPPACFVRNGLLYMLEGNKVLGCWRQGIPVPVSATIAGDIHAGDIHAGDIDAGDSHAGDRPAQTFRLFHADNMTHLLRGSQLYRIDPTPDGNLTSRFLVDIGFINNITAIIFNPQLDLLLIATGTDGFYALQHNRLTMPAFKKPLRSLLEKHLFGPMALLDSQQVLTNKFTFDIFGNFQQLGTSPGIRYNCFLTSASSASVWTAVGNIPTVTTAKLDLINARLPLDSRIISIRQDATNRLYCLTQTSIWKLDGDNFTRVAKNPLPLKGQNESFEATDSGHFLIANTEGLMDYDADANAISEIPLFKKSHVRSIHRCRDGSILIGTYGQGYFYRYQGRYYRMPLDKNGYLITAHAFLEDSHGDIWIPCNKGLFRVPKNDLDTWCRFGNNPIYYYHYSVQDGLQTNEFNGGYNESALITPHNFVAILSMKGIVCFNTDSLRASFPTGKMSISHIEIDGHSFNKYDSISLPPDYNSLLVEISCPYLGNRDNLYMEYRLKGLDSAWGQIPDDGSINLSRLGSGQYTLQVRKVNGFGKDNYCYREWPITVVPHWYNSAWFRILAILAVAVLILLLVQLTLKLNEKRREIRINNDKLRGAVSTLEATVRKLQDSEKALLHTSQLREKLISLVIHDLRSPLRFLTMLAADLHDNQSRLTPEDMKERSYWVKKGTHDIYHFSEDFLLWVTSQKDNFSIAKSRFSLKSLLQEINEFFSEQVQQKGNTLSIEADENLFIYSDPHILLTIIRNLVDNANKYTDQGTITLRATEQSPWILIDVADTGKGMDTAQIERFLQHENLDNVQTGSQLGHKFVFDLTSRIDGRISIQSQPGKGTTVQIRLPGEPA